MTIQYLPKVSISQELKASGAPMPINQNGVRPGPKKWAQFRLACDYAKAPNGPGDGDYPQTALVKIFNPCGNWSWYVTMYDPESDEAWGVVHGLSKESGPFTLRELAEYRGPLGIGLELDNWFHPTPVEELLK